jgi:hypothetical protein
MAKNSCSAIESVTPSSAKTGPNCMRTSRAAMKGVATKIDAEVCPAAGNVEQIAGRGNAKSALEFELSQPLVSSRRCAWLLLGKR